MFFMSTSLLLFFSSVTACWPLLEWVAWWRMRPQFPQARQRCLLSLKYRDIFIYLDIFLYPVSLIWNNPWCGLSEVQGLVWTTFTFTSEEQLQEQTHELDFLIMFVMSMCTLTLTPPAAGDTVALICFSYLALLIYITSLKNIWFRCHNISFFSVGTHFLLYFQNEPLHTM